MTGNAMEENRTLQPVTGQLLRSQETGHTYRLLYISSGDDNVCWWIDVDSKGNIPRSIHASDLISGLGEGKLVAVISADDPIDEDTLSPAMKKSRDKAWKLIRGVVDKEPQIYQPEERKKLLIEAAAEGKVQVPNLYPYLGRYWKGGKNMNALLPGFRNCGGHRKPTYSTWLGRPKRTGNNGKILTEQDLKNFADAYDRHYLAAGTTATLNSTYQWMIGLKYVEKDDQGQAKSLPPDEIPSLEQFLYWYRKNRKGSIKDLKKKEGEHRYALNHRPITGKTEITVSGPGEKAQIDGTIGDFYLVRKNHREEVIGRPVVFFVRDSYSHIVTGLHISLTDASWKQALLAIKNSAEDKVEFCRRYGIEIREEDWPCHHLPSVLIADNGELGGKGVEELIAKLGIMVENCPPYRGDLKGVIENNFHICQGKLKDIVPGYVDKDAGTRGAKDYRTEACMDLESFTRGMILCVLLYNKTWMDADSYQRTPEMIRDGVNATPLDLWNYGMKYCGGALRVVSKEDMYRVLLPHGSAKVTERGIHFQGLYYTCKEAVQEDWFASARSSGRYSITVSYDPSCVDNIYVTDKDGRLISCTLLERSTPFRGMTKDDMDLYQEEDRRQKAEYNAKQNQANAEFQQEMNKLVRQNSSQKAGVTKIREALVRKGIDVSREEEQDELSGAADARKRQEEAPQTKPKAGDSLYIDNEELQDGFDEVLRKAGILPPK